MARITYVAGMQLSMYDSAGEKNYYTFGETTFNGSNGKYFKIAPNFTVLSMDEINLKTTIRVYLDWVSTSYSGSGTAVKGYINGNLLANTYTSIGTNQTRYMGSYDFEISHDATTGQGSIDITCLVDSAWNGLGDAQSTTKIYTNTYKRASGVTATSGYIGENITINITEYDSRYTYTLQYAFGNEEKVFYDDYNQSSLQWTLPDSLYAQIPNDPSGTGVITCRTRLNGRTIGSNSCPFTARVDASKSKPTVSISAKDTNTTATNLTGSNQKLIRYISNVEVTGSANANNSATLTSTSIYCGNGQTVGGTSYTFNGVDSGYFRIDASDSRGFPNSKDIQLEMVPYIPLTLQAEAYRPTQTGGEIRIDIHGNYFNGSFGASDNSLTVKYRMREKDTSYPDEYTTVTPTINEDGTYSLDMSVGSDFDYKKSYDFEFLATDKIISHPAVYDSVSQGIPIVGKFEKFIELWGKSIIKLDGDDIKLNLFPVNYVLITTENVNPSKYYYGTWQSWGSGRVPVGIDTSQAEFNTVEKTGGSKELQSHTHSASTSINNVSLTGNLGNVYSGTINNKSGIVTQKNIQSYRMYTLSGTDTNNWADWVIDASHNHSASTSIGYTGNGNAGNLPPYITCYMWKRVS